MRHHVYYDDDYPEMGGVGFESFDSQEEALKFIGERRKGSDLSRYTYIVGDVQPLRIATQITSVEVGK